MSSMLSKTPIECPQFLLSRAQAKPCVATAIVNAGAHLPMESARLAAAKGLIEPVLIGDPVAIKAIAKDIAWDIASFRVVAAEGEVASAASAVALARSGEVASLMKGDLHTDHLLRAVLNKTQGLRRTDNRLSHVFHMTMPGSEAALCITDGAINVQPDVDTKIHIARNAIELLHRLGNAVPKVAVLSATEQETDAIPSSIDAADLVQRAEQELPGALVDGPFALDIAVSPEAARIKGVHSEVAGRADVLLVPNIETGNALFKQMVYFMSAAAAGIVLGAKVPITLTSRADPPAARLASAALAAIYAGAE